MPMTFDDETVRETAKWRKVPLEPAETLRERLAQQVETCRSPDYVEGWEIRTGRPWTQMTAQEARDLVQQHPELVGNMGVASRLRSGQGGR